MSALRAGGVAACGRQGVDSVLATNDQLRHLVVSIQPSIDGLSYFLICLWDSTQTDTLHPTTDGGGG